MTKFEEKVKPILGYIGIIGSALMAVAYLFVVVVMIKGFKVQPATSTFLFAGINAVIGLLISNFLKYQGIAFAEMIPANQTISTAYYNTKTHDKKTHGLSYFWVTTLVKDVLVKGLSFIVATTGIIYIVIEGSNDWNLLLLAFVNLTMFICFGLLSLVKAYDYYNNVYVPYMNEKIKEATNESQS